MTTPSASPDPDPGPVTEIPNVAIAAMNLRELGGYETSDGARVRHGILWRGGHMADLDAAQLDRLRALGLRTIVDLRRPIERAERPTPDVGADTVSCSVSDDDNEFAVVVNRLAEPGMAGRAAEYARTYYRNAALVHVERFAPAIRAVVDAQRSPVLFHCTAGKDRTGIVAATVLSLLGVPAETVMEDFLATNTVRAATMADRLALVRAEKAVERGISPDDMPDEEVAAIRTLMTVQPSYLESYVSAVHERFGSWASMAREAFGIDDAGLAGFRAAALR